MDEFSREIQAEKERRRAADAQAVVRGELTAEELRRKNSLAAQLDLSHVMDELIRDRTL